MIYAIPGDVFKHIEFDQVDLILADPPYGNIVADDYDRISDKDLVSLLFKVAYYAYNSLVNGGSLILFGGIGKPKSRPFLEFASTLESHYSDLYIRDWITWGKARGYGVATRYLFTSEEILWIVKGDKPYYFDKPHLDEEHSEATKGCLKNAKHKPHSSYKRRTNVWTDVKEIMCSKVVSAEKPERLYEILIGTHCKPGGVIVDMFGGSGNSAVVASRLGRNISIYEKDKTVYDIMTNNIRNKIDNIEDLSYE